MAHLTQEQTEEFKKKLEAEKARLESELDTIGKRTGRAGDWDATTDEIDADVSADKNDRADAIEDFEENTAIVTELEAQLKDVADALARIDAGTYGHDETTNEPIPVERLNANPAARTALPK